MNNKKQTGIIGFILKLVVSMIVIAITNILVPGMSNKGGIGNLALIAIVIAVIDYLLARFLGLSKAASISTKDPLWFFISCLRQPS